MEEAVVEGELNRSRGLDRSFPSKRSLHVDTWNDRALRRPNSPFGSRVNGSGFPDVWSRRD